MHILGAPLGKVSLLSAVETLESCGGAAFYLLVASLTQVVENRVNRMWHCKWRTGRCGRDESAEDKRSSSSPLGDALVKSLLRHRLLMIALKDFALIFYYKGLIH